MKSTLHLRASSQYHNILNCTDVFTREVMVCEDMFTSEDTGLQIADVTAMNLTLEDMTNVGHACYHDRISANLQALGYNTDTFCPMFETVLPLQFQVLGDVITSVSILGLSHPPIFTMCVTTHNHTIASTRTLLAFALSSLMLYSNLRANQSMSTKGILFELAFIQVQVCLNCYSCLHRCYRRMEEVQLTDAIRQGARYSFPNIVNTTTFESSYMTVCTSNSEPFFYDPENCTTSMEAVIEASTVFMPGNETMISYLSNLCDAFSLPLPHPNETIRLRYADKHVHHKPGGKVSSNLFSNLFRNIHSMICSK